MVARDGCRIAYRVTGTGRRVLIFLHAVGVSGRYFTETVENLDLAAVRAITVDLRGHGDSDKPDVELTWDLLAGDVLAVADHAGADTFVAVGHSLGGKLSQYLPLVDPARVEALVLVTSPSAGTMPIPDFVSAWVDLAGDGDALVEESIKRFLRAPVPDGVLRRAAQEASKIPRTYLQKTLQLVATTSFAEQLGTMRIPVLVVSTDDNPLHTTEHQILDSFPDARTRTMSCGSEIPMEQPEAFAGALQEFISQLP